MNKKYGILILLFMVSINARAGITKWGDSSGQVHYSNLPSPSNSNASEVRIYVAPVDEDAAKQRLSDIDTEISTQYQKQATADDKHREDVKQKAKAKANAEALAEARRKAIESSTVVTTTTWTTRVPAGTPTLNFNPMGGVYSGGSVSAAPHK